MIQVAKLKQIGQIGGAFMIEVKELIGDRNKFQLSIDGNIVESKNIKIFDLRNNIFYVDINDSNDSLVIMQNKIESLSKDIGRLSLNYPQEFCHLIQDIVIRRDYQKKEIIYFEYEFSWEIDKWKKPYSIEEFGKVMEQVTLLYHEAGIEWIHEDEVISNGCELRCYNFHRGNTIHEIHLNHIEIIEEICSKAALKLHQSSEESSIVSIFDFPEEVKAACEQYLIYFIQFLREIGIDAKANIKDEAGKVLFSVVPLSNETALRRIRDALDIYLQLPILFNNVNYTQIPMDTNVQQLVANIQHLNSQLMLSRAIIQTNQLTIGNQQKLIEQQQKVLDSTIFQQSLVETNTKFEEGEDILGGTIKLQKYKGNGFQVDIPNIYRLIMNKLGSK